MIASRFGECYFLFLLLYRVTIVVRDTDFVDFKIRVALSIRSLHLPGPETQFSEKSTKVVSPTTIVTL